MLLTKKNHIVAIVVCLLFSTKQLIAQEEAFHKNAIHASIGNGGLYFSATVNYERMIKQKMFDKNIASFVRVAYGAEAHYGGESEYFLLQYGILTGVKTHHFEASLGPSYFSNDNLLGKTPLTGAIGWRIQKPGGNFIFRMGVGVPEAIYVGLGISF